MESTDRSFITSMKQERKPKRENRNQEREPRYEVDYTKFDWSKRHVDPMIKMAWVALIKVEPAVKEKGQNVGWRTYPDGVREAFYRNQP